MNILLTNDDGIYADGISAMYQALRQKGHEVVVVAPDSERSAVGHAITVSDPLKVAFVDVEARIRGYAIKGTPTDCVKLTVNALLDVKPDLVISGINKGANTGYHIIYSGTVSAATEASMFGLTAMAVSLDVSLRKRGAIDYGYAAQFATNLCDVVARQGGLPEGTLLNVNVPASDPQQIKGVRICKQARFHLADEYEKRVDPFERTYYWPKLEQVRVTNSPEVEVDYRLLKEGFIVVTPIQYDLTDYKMMVQLQQWAIEV